MSAPDARSPLLSPDALAARLGDPELVVLDVRSAGYGGGRSAFDAGHIPGAVHTDYVEDGWRAARGGAAGLLPGADSLSGLFGRLGIRPGRLVVVVPAGLSSGDFSVAARIYWTLRAAGHAKLAMLDGGFAAWEEAGLPVEPGEPPGRSDDLYPVAFDPSVRALLADVEGAIAAGSPTLIDSRGAKAFRGEEKSPQAKRAGRLPGAVNVEGAGAYEPGANRLKPRDALLAPFASLPDGPVIAFCNTGQAAATTWFVLSEVLGRPGTKLYDGSMSEWTQDDGRPVETG